MNSRQENNLILRVCEFGYKNQRFTLADVQHSLGLSPEDITFVYNVMTSRDSATNNPNHVLITDGVSGNGKPLFSITPSALFSYVDHLEIIEARKAAREAKRLSIAAIIISSILAIAQIVFAINFEK